MGKRFDVLKRIIEIDDYELKRKEIEVEKFEPIFLTMYDLREIFNIWYDGKQFRIMLSNRNPIVGWERTSLKSIKDFLRRYTQKFHYVTEVNHWSDLEELTKNDQETYENIKIDFKEERNELRVKIEHYVYQNQEPHNEDWLKKEIIIKAKEGLK